MHRPVGVGTEVGTAIGAVLGQRLDRTLDLQPERPCLRCGSDALRVMLPF